MLIYIYLDESKVADTCDKYAINIEKFRLDTKTYEQTKDKHGIIVTVNNTNDEQSSSTHRRDTRYLTQQNIDHNTLNLSSKRKTGKIQLNEALIILEKYHARYRARCDGKRINFISRFKIMRFLKNKF